MTLNKAQGKTFSRGLLLLTRDVFAHGQLYVGLTRFGAASDVAVLVSPERRIDWRAVVLNVVSSSLAQPVYQEFASLRPPLGGRTRLVYINIFLNFSCWFHTAPIGFNGKPIANTVCMYATYAYANLFEIQKQSACGAVYSTWSKHLIWQISKWLLFHKKKCYWFLIQILRV